MNFTHFLILIFIFSCFFVPSARAANPGDVVINEIAWMGTTNSHNDEWLELYNNTDVEISIDGWILRATGDKPNRPNITMAGTVSSHGFFLLERTDDTSVPNIQANQIYTGLLGNDGEHLELIGPQGNIVDRVNSFRGWLAGDNTDKYTMERKNPKLAGSDSASWGTSASPGGTPKAQNSVYSAQESQISDPVPAPGPTEAQQTVSEPLNPAPVPAPETQPDESEKTASTQAQASYPQNIFINELMPYPLGPDELEEWVEIINESTEPADISLWQIKDTLGATNIYALPKGTIIAKGGVLVLSRLTTNITLNNDGDAVQIIRPDGELAQTAPYEKAEKGKSYVRESGLWKWSSVPTPGSANIVPAPVKNTLSVEDVKKVVKEYGANTSPQTPNLTPELPLPARPAGGLNKERGAEGGEVEYNDSSAHQLASVGETSTAKISSELTAFIASFIALLSAVFIFLLKKRLAK